MLSETNRARVAVVLHSAVAVAVGLVSSRLPEAWYAFILSVVVLYALGMLTNKTYGKGKERNWWLANGVFVYLFSWFAAWVYFVNA